MVWESYSNVSSGTHLLIVLATAAGRVIIDVGENPF